VRAVFWFGQRETRSCLHFSETETVNARLRRLVNYHLASKGIDPMKLLVSVPALIVLTTLPLAASGSDKKGTKQSKTGAQQTQPGNVDLSQPLTLENAIKIGLRNQQSLAIAKDQLSASKARVTEARASYFPSIAPTFQYSNQLSSVTVNGVKQTGIIEQSVTQIAARQLIFDTGKREENVLSSRYSAKASEFNVLDTRQIIISNVSTSYYELLRRRELVKVAKASVDRAKTTLDFTTASAEVGTGPKKDILQADADFKNANVQLIIAQNDVILAATALKTAMGVLSMMPIVVPEAPVPPPSTTPDPKSAGEYLQSAYNKRLDLKSQTASIDANRHQVKIAQINAGPVVQADITEGYRIDPSPGENRNFTTSFSYPLFDAGLTRAQVRQARANLDISRSQLQLTKQNIQSDVEQSYIIREEARLRVTATDAALKAARLNYEAATTALREGAGTIIDVITAQTALVTAETNAVQAIFDFYTNDARLKRALGDNDPYLAGGI
jgi:outer membrane protein